MHSTWPSPPVAAAADAPLLPSFAAFATSARQPLSSSALPWSSARSNDQRYQQSSSPLSPARQAGPATVGPAQAVAARVRALTSSERGRQFRLRERVHEQCLIKNIKEIREQIAQLESSRDLLKQRSFMTRTSSGGSLEKIVRELYSVYRNGLESLDPRATAAIGSQSHGDLFSIVNYKEHFLRGIVEQDAMCGDVVGVDALLEQWRKHTLSYTKFEIVVVRVEPTAGSVTHPIVVVRTKVNARFSRETLAVMFPGVVESRPDLARKFINRDIVFDCISRFTFSERGQISTYLISMNTVEALMKAVDSARDVVELMAFSVMTPSLAIRDLEPPHNSSVAPEFSDGQNATSGRGDVHTWKRASEYTEEQIAPVPSDQWREAYGDHRGRREDQFRLPATPARSSISDEESGGDTSYSYVLQV
ncbi:hypothetical protein Gpo141_00012581 [Globisporangium polare]